MEEFIPQNGVKTTDYQLAIRAGDPNPQGSQTSTGSCPVRNWATQEFRYQNLICFQQIHDNGLDYFFWQGIQ